MSSPSDFPKQPVSREAKEKLLQQRGLVVWIYGLSGSGKSTLATALEHSLHSDGRFTTVLDGDVVRAGLNQGLAFSESDRLENIRRVAEVAKLQCGSGLITICSFITPTQPMRELARQIVGSDDFLEIYLNCSFETCAGRDVKGLYAKAQAGDIKQFTGQDSVFEPSETADLVLDTENQLIEDSQNRLYQLVASRIHPAGSDLDPIPRTEHTEE